MSPSNQQIKLDPKTGAPFTSREAAEAFIKKTELDTDLYDVMPEASGFAVATLRTIIDTQAERDKRREAADKAKAKVKKQKYWRILVQPGGENALDHVPMCIGDLEIRVMRGQEGIVPDNFKRLLDDASHTNWIESDDPQQPVKDGGQISRFPYQTLGEATKEEYLEMLAKGNKTTKEALARKHKQAD